MFLKANLGTNILTSSTQAQQGVKIISSVIISEVNDEANRKPLLFLNSRFRLSSLKGRPWSIFTKTLTTNSISSLNNGTNRIVVDDLVNGNENTTTTIIGKKIVLTKEMIRRLTPLSGNFKSKSQSKIESGGTVEIT